MTYDNDISWIKRDLDEIKQGIKNIDGKLENHEKRISRLEGANRIWIPAFLSFLGLMVGIILGHITL